MSDKFGGAAVTQVSSAVMVAAALGAAYYMKLAYSSATPELYFVPFDETRDLAGERIHAVGFRHFLCPAVTATLTR